VLDASATFIASSTATGQSSAPPFPFAASPPSPTPLIPPVLAIEDSKEPGSIGISHSADSAEWNWDQANHAVTAGTVLEVVVIIAAGLLVWFVVCLVKRRYSSLLSLTSLEGLTTGSGQTSRCLPDAVSSTAVELTDISPPASDASACPLPGYGPDSRQIDGCMEPASAKTFQRAILSEGHSEAKEARQKLAPAASKPDSSDQAQDLNWFDHLAKFLLKDAQY